MPRSDPAWTCSDAPLPGLPYHGHLVLLRFCGTSANFFPRYLGSEAVSLQAKSPMWSVRRTRARSLCSVYLFVCPPGFVFQVAFGIGGGISTSEIASVVGTKDESAKYSIRLSARDHARVRISGTSARRKEICFPGGVSIRAKHASGTDSIGRDVPLEAATRHRRPTGQTLSEKGLRPPRNAKYGPQTTAKRLQTFSTLAIDMLIPYVRCTSNPTDLRESARPMSERFQTIRDGKWASLTEKHGFLGSGHSTVHLRSVGNSSKREPFLPFHPFSAKYSFKNVMMVSACFLAAAVLWTVLIGVGGVGVEERTEERLRRERYVLTPKERADVSALVGSNHVASTTADYASHRHCIERT